MLISILCVFTKKKLVNPYSAGIDFGRQNLTSVDVRFWRLKSIPAPQNIGIQMNQKELTKTFIKISNRKKPFAFHHFQKKIQRLNS